VRGRKNHNLRRDIEQAKSNIAAEKSVGPQARRIREVFSSIQSPNIGCHE